MSRSALTGVRLLCAAFLAGGMATGCGRQESPIIVPRPPEVQAELTYVLARTYESGMERLDGVAVDAGGLIYLAGSEGVRVIDDRGEQVRLIATEGPAECAAVAPDGTLYVGLTSHVAKYDRDGNLTATWNGDGHGAGRFSVITGISVAGADVYVADAGQRCVHRFDTTGDFIADIGRPEADAEVPGIICPSPHLDCAVDAAGMLNVNNPGRRRVERYAADGRLLGWWGVPGMHARGFCGCCNPTDIALAPDGRIVTSEKGIPRVKVYDAQGRMLAYIGPENFSRGAVGLDLAVGPNGWIYVADPGDGKVRAFRRAGEDVEG